MSATPDPLAGGLWRLAFAGTVCVNWYTLFQIVAMSLVVQTLSEQIFTLVRDRIITGSSVPETAIRKLAS